MKHAGVDVAHRRAAQAEDADQCVRATVADEGDFLAVGRPAWLRIVAADVAERPCARETRNRRQPQLMLAAPDRVFPVGGDLDVLAAFGGAVHRAEQPRLAVRDVGRPHLLLGLVHVAGRVGHFALRVRLAAARIHGRATIRREPESGHRHAVVPGVMGHLPAGEPRAVGHPDVARAPQVEDPGDPLAALCRRELIGKRISERLRHGEPLRPRRLRRQQQHRQEPCGEPRYSAARENSADAHDRCLLVLVGQKRSAASAGGRVRRWIAPRCGRGSGRILPLEHHHPLGARELGRDGGAGNSGADDEDVGLRADHGGVSGPLKPTNFLRSSWIAS